MDSWKIEQAPVLRAEITVPGDKSISHRAVILAGLSNGTCKITGFLPSEDCLSTMQAMRALGVEIERPTPTTLIVHGRSRQLTAPKGDIDCGNSGTTMRLLSGVLAAQPGSHLLVTNVGLNETRTGVLAVLVRMGAHVREIIEVEEGEPCGTVEIQGAKLKGTVIRGKEIPNVIDELPILAVAGALAQGTTIIADAAELRVKETDRLAAIATNLRAMGVTVAETEDGLEIFGGTPLKGARLSSFGDHRIAMAFAIAGLFAEGETIIDGVECVATSYPGFSETLLRLVTQRNKETPVVSSLPHREK